MAPVYDKEEEAVCLHRAELFLAARGKVDFFSEVDVFEQPVALAIEEQMLVDRDTARDFEQVAALDQWVAQQMFDAVDRDRKAPRHGILVRHNISPYEGTCALLTFSTL